MPNKITSATRKSSPDAIARRRNVPLLRERKMNSEAMKRQIVFGREFHQAPHDEVFEIRYLAGGEFRTRPTIRCGRCLRRDAIKIQHPVEALVSSEARQISGLVAANRRVAVTIGRSGVVEITRLAENGESTSTGPLSGLGVPFTMCRDSACRRGRPRLCCPRCSPPR